MPPKLNKISPCLWFDTQGEEAANFYVSLFPDSRVTHVARYPEAGVETHGQKPGSVMTVTFELAGQTITALNGGPHFKFSEAISLMVACDSQAEVDALWEKLGAGGDPNAQQCGWLKDRFGLSWQIVPRRMFELYESGDHAAVNRTMNAMLKMKKLDLAVLEAAYAGRA